MRGYYGNPEGLGFLAFQIAMCIIPKAVIPGFRIHEKSYSRSSYTTWIQIDELCIKKFIGLWSIPYARKMSLFFFYIGDNEYAIKAIKSISQYHFKSIVYSNANIQCYNILNAKWKSQKKLRNGKQFMRWHRVSKKCWDHFCQNYQCHISWRSQYHFKYVYSNANIHCYVILNAKW